MYAALFVVNSIRTQVPLFFPPRMTCLLFQNQNMISKNTHDVPGFTLTETMLYLAQIRVFQHSISPVTMIIRFICYLFHVSLTCQLTLQM